MRGRVPGRKEGEGAVSGGQRNPPLEGYEKVEEVQAPAHGPARPGKDVPGEYADQRAVHFEGALLVE
jgi:hypothetical protein